MKRAGIYLFGHFSTSHTFTKTVKQDVFPTWVDYALYHTVDINTQNVFVSWIMGYYRHINVSRALFNHHMAMRI